MNSLDQYFLYIAEKHHGHEPNFVESLFETSLVGDVLVDGAGNPVWRGRRPGEDDLPDDQPNPSPRESAAARGSPTAKPKEMVPMNAPAQSVPPASRMSLANVTRGKQKRPHRVVLYGPEGIGKSTFGAGAPSPIFLPIEEGTNHLDVVRFPKAESWREAREAVRSLLTDKHSYETLVIDTLDALEPMLWRHMVDRDVFADASRKVKLADIESYGYGKGYVKALDDWRALLKDLELLTHAGMNIILLAHSWVKAFKNPAGEDYDRYELKLHVKAGGLFKEWCESLLFANYETFAKKDERTKRVRGVDTGARLIFTERRAAYDAKHRGNLPESLPLSWTDYASESLREVDAKALAAEILRKAAELGGDVEKVVAETVKKAADNVQSLININNRVNTRLAEKAAQEEGN